MTDFPPWEEIEHTADWALRVRGNTLLALFENAARGMVSLIGGEANPDSDPVLHRINLNAPDLETLLVDWLTEIIFMTEDQLMFFEDISVRSLNDLTLDASLKGIPDSAFEKHIKAVTYHQLVIEKHQDYFETTVVFDV